MSRVRHAALIVFCLLFAATAWAQPKGRINGKIVDDQGKPAPNVVVRASRAGDAAVMEAKTNDKGEWEIRNLAVGQWNFEFGKDGFEPQRMTVAVAENRNPPIEMKLTVAVDPNVEIQAEVKKAQELQQAGKLADARKVVLDLLAKYPVAVRLNAFVASTYEAEKNYDKAIEHIKLVVEKEPADLDIRMYLAELLSAKGDKVEAQKVLDAVDMTQVKDPTVFINMAIAAINAQRSDEAIAILDKVSKTFPTRADLVYYRARANIVGKKMAEAKADLEKFVSMAPPDSPQLADAKKLLEQLKDVK
jgi:predicted Zn-dependent protease